VRRRLWAVSRTVLLYRVRFWVTGVFGGGVVSPPPTPSPSSSPSSDGSHDNIDDGAGGQPPCKRQRCNEPPHISATTALPATIRHPLPATSSTTTYTANICRLTIPHAATHLRHHLPTIRHPPPLTSHLLNHYLPSQHMSPHHTSHLFPRSHTSINNLVMAPVPMFRASTNSTFQPMTVPSIRLAGFIGVSNSSGNNALTRCRQ
jgi:hypothetical protein